MPIDYTKLLTPEQQAQLAPIPERQTQSPKLSAPMQVGLNVNEKESFVGAPVPVINGGTVPQEQRVENVRQRALEEARQGVASATETRNSLLQQMFDARRQDLEKERTGSTQMALYNSFGNLLRTMVQPIGWAGGRATAGVQPYDERQYLDAYNRAVRASDDIRNLGFQENQLRLNYADRDVQNAERRLNINEMRDEKMLDNYLGIGTSAGRGRDIHEDRKTEAVRAWTIHNNGMSLSQYIRTIQGHFPDFFGEWNPNEEELEKIEEDLKKNNGKKSGRKDVMQEETGTSTANGEKPAGGTVVTPLAPPTGSALTDSDKKIIEAWSQYDTNKDGVLDKDEQKVYNSNRGSRPKMTSSARRMYEAAAKKNSSTKPASGKANAKSIMGS